MIVRVISKGEQAEPVGRGQDFADYGEVGGGGGFDSVAAAVGDLDGVGRPASVVATALMV